MTTKTSEGRSEGQEAPWPGAAGGPAALRRMGPPESPAPPKVSSSQREFFLATVASQSLDSRTNPTRLISSDTKNFR